jgi:hypothetical protein
MAVGQSSKELTMINLVFTLVSAVLGVAMFAVVLFSNAAEASTGTAGGDVQSTKSAGRPHALSMLAIDDVRTGASAWTKRDAGRPAGAARTRHSTSLQMAAQMSGTRSKQL